ncbi:GGDEF domain-containing protein [Luteimonas sp. RD2P54]|uniref:diguanylate cyclase n=1 Tax=Luteimonas endophytica TaxID=3042023 RepID=A0ABT6J9U6_9GAMM|nr:GGDEF domain-containing protein [Luteimonas endophytica]MDH5822968.1 GGDEF domain-containing protein [Luteimonas endophytica]
MPERPVAQERSRLRARNLLVQEVAETRQRARLGGGFYGIAAALAFGVTGFAPPYRWSGLLVVGTLVLLAVARVLLPVPAAPGEAEARRYLRRIWGVILATAVAWGSFSAWSQTTLPAPAPLITLLFSGAFGMAIAHTLCMRRLPAAIAIAAVMAPTLVVLWGEVAFGVGATWLVYMAYMLLVMGRSHREYWERLELEEELRQQRDVFATQSRVDGLTGLPNRREFSESLERAMEAAGGGQSLSLLILDIDHFKRINDSFGHLAGDACLLRFAGRLREAFPGEGELCARLGGEEFGVVLPVDRATARARAEGFREALERVPLEFDGVQRTVTASIGCCGFDVRRHADADALYREADAALYRAKVGGRNRTECAPAA